jgi:hypothetical protein
MKLVALVAVFGVLALAALAVDLDVWSGTSPDKTFLAAERRVPETAMMQRLDLDGTRVVISSLDRSGSISAVYAQHDFPGRLITKIQWSPDSKFLLFTTASSGGHSPWHFQTFVFVAADKTFRDVDALVGPVTDPNPEFTPPDVVTLKVRDYSHEVGEPGDSKEVRISLSEKAPKMPLHPNT